MVVTIENCLFGKRKLLFEIEKKERQKLKIYQKLQSLLDEQEPLVQSAADRTKSVQVWKSGITVCIYSPRKLALLHLYIWHLKTNANSRFHAR